MGGYSFGLPLAMAQNPWHAVQIFVISSEVWRPWSVEIMKILCFPFFRDYLRMQSGKGRGPSIGVPAGSPQRVIFERVWPVMSWSFSLAVYLDSGFRYRHVVVMRISGAR